MKVTRYVSEKTAKALVIEADYSTLGRLYLNKWNVPDQPTEITIELPDPPLEIEGLQDTENLTCVCVPASPGGPSCASEPPPCRKVALVEKGTQ